MRIEIQLMVNTRNSVQYLSGRASLAHLRHFYHVMLAAWRHHCGLTVSSQTHDHRARPRHSGRSLTISLFQIISEHFEVTEFLLGFDYICA